MKTALDETLNILETSRASEGNLNQKIQQLRFDMDNQVAFSDKLLREQSEMRGLLTVYE